MTVRAPRTPMATWTLSVLAVAGFHAVEHVVQAVQKYAMDGVHPHGLLGAWVNNDPMHFAYNVAFLAALAPVAALRGAGGTRWGWGLFTGGLVLQGVHVVEHTAKLAQWMAGEATAYGILGRHFELIPLHLTLNSAVYLMVAPYLWQVARPRVTLLRSPSADALRAP